MIKRMCKFEACGVRALRNAILVTALTLLTINWAWAAPIGLAAIERLDQISLVRPGVRAYQYSSHDLSGGNGDASYYLQTTGGEDVLFDVKGPGCIYRFWWTNCNLYDQALRNIRIYFDGAVTPQFSMTVPQFFSGSQAPFLSPLVGNNNVSSGGNYCYLPMPFRTGCKITMTGGGEPPINWYNITYQRFADATGVTTFTGQENSAAARNVWNTVTADPKPDHGTNTISGTINITNGSTATLANISTGGTIQELEITIPGLSTAMLTGVTLRAQWDGAAPAIDAPMGYFFGCGLGVRNVRSVPVGMNSSTKKMYCYLPMPFAGSALIQLVNNTGGTLSNVNYTVRYTPQTGGLRGMCYLNAKYLSETPTTIGRDYTMLNETGSGHFIGVVEGMRGPNLTFLEGDERIYVDGSLTPQIQGTGTEDFYNGACYFANGAFTLPVHGAPLRLTQSGENVGAYRFFLSDLIPFTSSIKVGMEHNGGNEDTPNYYSVAFYYKSTQPASTLTDTLDVGNSASESAHNYTVNTATWSGTTTGYYEGDDDGISVTDNGRRHAGYSRFVVAIDPTNAGLLLRRRMDYSLPRQDALVYVDGSLVGEWYDAGSNAYKVFQDAEFMVPPSFTEGKSSVTIKIVNASTESNWTEYRYWVYSLPLQAPRLNVKPGGTITVDGSTGDWNLSEFTTYAKGGQPGAGDIALVGYDGGGALCYAGYYTGGVLPTSAADHTAKVYSRQDEDYLYFLVRCDDSDIRYNNPVSSNWLNDCVEFFIDPGNDGGSAPMSNSASDVQLDIDANNQKNVCRCTDAYKAQILAGLTSAVSRDSTGWWLEMRIRNDALSPAVPTNGTIGLDFNFRDNDNNNDAAQTTVYGWADTASGLSFPSNIPDNWGHAFLHDTTPPRPVTNFTIVQTDNGELTLSWTNPTNLDFAGTKILFKTTGYPSDPNDATATVIYDDVGTNFAHSGLTNGQTYYYSAFARDAAPNYSTRATVSATPVYIPPPGPVTNFKAYGGSERVDLAWTNPTDPILAGVRILCRATSGYPLSPTDPNATVIYSALGTSCSHTGLINGTKYYYAAYAYTTPTMFSGAAQSSTYAAAEVNIPAMKGLANSVIRSVKGNVVTAVFSGNFYMQDPLSPYGLKVSTTETPLPSIGQKVDVVGSMTGIAGNERALNCTNNSIRVTDPGPITIGPAALNNKAVGGANLNTYTPGVVDGTGANNVGLLVRVCGIVTQTQSGQYFYVDDGCGLKDGTKTSTIDNVGVRIKVTSIPSGVVAGKYVVVTGIVSPFSATGLRRQILPLPQPTGVQIVGP